MNFLEKLKNIAVGVQTTADALGKLVWVFIIGFITLAISTGNPSLLGLIKTRLVLLGITSLKTPFGDLDPVKIGKINSESEILGINAVIAKDLAANMTDLKAKEQLNTMAKQLERQQQEKTEQLARISSSQQIVNQPASLESSDKDYVKQWLYLGRHSSEGWKPYSFSLEKPAYPIKGKENIVVKANALLYGGIDCKHEDISKLSASAGGGKVETLFVKAGPEPIFTTGETVVCPSGAGVELVWAQVKVPASRLINIQ
jgi:hypothetical protein